jgi:hypothetical protein
VTAARDLALGHRGGDLEEIKQRQLRVQLWGRWGGGEPKGVPTARSGWWRRTSRGGWRLHIAGAVAFCR